MSMTDMNIFRRACAADPALKIRMDEASTPAEMTKIARAAGFDVTIEEITSGAQYSGDEATTELTGNELDGIAGGCPPIRQPPQMP